jgi:hypothetical protein
MSNPLVHALEVTDMVMIDDLYAFDLELDEEGGLIISCMDGSRERHWAFTPDQVAGATPLTTPDEWKIQTADSEHRLRLLEAFSAEEDEDQA